MIDRSRTMIVSAYKCGRRGAHGSVGCALAREDKYVYVCLLCVTRLGTDVEHSRFHIFAINMHDERGKYFIFMVA